jgi:hypothetical protein
VKGGIAESVESYLVMYSAYVSSLLFDGFPEADEVLEGDSGMDRYAAHRCSTTPWHNVRTDNGSGCEPLRGYREAVMGHVSHGSQHTV